MSLDIKQLEDQCREARLAYEAHLMVVPVRGTEQAWIGWAVKSAQLQQQSFDAEMKLLMARYRGQAVAG